MMMWYCIVFPFHLLDDITLSPHLKQTMISLHESHVKQNSPNTNASQLKKPCNCSIYPDTSIAPAKGNRKDSSPRKCVVVNINIRNVAVTRGYKIRHVVSEKCLSNAIRLSHCIAGRYGLSDTDRGTVRSVCVRPGPSDV